jgi:hypothetical protein
MVSVVPRPDFTPRSLKTRFKTGLATRKNSMTASSRSTSSDGTPAVICISPAPARSIPNSSAASMMPIGFERPSSATVIASKPTVVLNVAFIWWLMPRMLIVPASPASMPAMLIVSVISRRGFMPA